MGLILMVLINWLLKFKMNVNTYFFKKIYMKVWYEFFIFWENCLYAWKQIIFFFVFIYIFFQHFGKKMAILILNLYLYSIVITQFLNK